MSSSYPRPRELAFYEIERDDVPTSVVQRYRNTGEEPWVWSLSEGGPRLPTEPGDVVLFWEDDRLIWIATAHAASDDSDLVADLWPQHDGGSELLFLSDVERIDTDLEDIERELGDIRFDPDFPGPDWSWSDEWGDRDAFYTAIDDVTETLETRRLYNLLDGPATPTSSHRYANRPVARLLDASLERVFQWLWGLRTFKIAGMFLLVTALVVGALNELLCVVGGLVLNLQGSCHHLFNLAFVDNATTLSFSLTAFLLVGVTVVVAVEQQRAPIGPDLGGTELRIGTGLDEVDRDEWLRIMRPSIERFVDGELDGSDTVEWYLQPQTYELILARRESYDPDSIHPPDGSYEIRVADRQTPPASPAWRLQGHLGGPPDQLDVLDRITGDDYEIDWWLIEADETPDLQSFRSRLGLALSYSVSASVLGIAIQWYPWVGPDETAPWLSGLAPTEHVLYAVGSVFFATIFLGMVWTSVDLVELMAEMRNEE